MKNNENTCKIEMKKKFKKVKKSNKVKKNSIK